jgi:predicted O-linked N-acetylglucosamine transferase (SPINDLY family)
MTVEAALVRLRQGDPAGALTLLSSREAEADRPASDAALGMVLLAADRPAEARVMLRAAVALGDTSPATLLNLALAEDRTGEQDRARGLMRELERRLPDWAEPPLRMAESLRAAGETQAAEAAYARVLEIDPRRIEALVALGALLVARSAGAEAQGLLLRACAIAPDNAEAWDALGLALMLTDAASLAQAAFAEAQRLAPRTLDFALHLLSAATAAGTGEAELARLEQLGRDDPLNVTLLIAQGALAEQLGRRAEAIDALEAAVALAPEEKLPAAWLGNALARTDRPREAQVALARAIALDPDNTQLVNNHAAVLMRLYRHAEAHAALTELIARDGPQVATLCNLANASVSLGLQEEAVATARQAIALAPDAVLPWRALCNSLPYRDGTGATELLDALQSCAALLARQTLPHQTVPAFANMPAADRRLRIGLLSGNLRTHPVGWLTIAGFETLDPAGFDIVCLGRNAAPDPIALRFAALAAEWHETDSLTDAALAAKARALGIDILIDLGGYGDQGRLPACALRLAPVQVKWVGMQNHSTGLPEIDWFLTDAIETPPELQHGYSERLLRLPDGYVCYSPPPNAPAVGPLPALANGYVSFGCFNNLAKITPRVIATWADILRRVPGARLVLKTHQFADPPTVARIRAAFAAHAIAPARIVLRGSSGHRAFLAEYNDIDLVLDPFPYAGGLTTCEALWMGAPVLTLPGEIFASRHSASHLTNVGLTDWVAPDLAGYVAMAVAKAADLEALATLRGGLRARMKASRLCDAPRFGRHLGAALRHAWRDWCASATDAAR